MVLELDENCGAATEEENQPVGNYKGDHQPEYFQYQDEGCRRARSCLACPFPRCFYDKPLRTRRSGKTARNKEINRLFQAGRKVKALARVFKVSQRTIFRAIKKNKDDERED